MSRHKKITELDAILNEDVNDLDILPIVDIDAETTKKITIAELVERLNHETNWGNIGGTLSDQTDLQNALDAKSDVGHTHDDRYFTEAEITALLAGKANTSHTHVEAEITDLDKYTQAEVDALFDNYYLQTEVDTLLDGKSDTGHTHTSSNITDFNSSVDSRITAQKGNANGLATLGADSKIPSSQLPALAITETFVVASEVAQLALTVQEGDVAVRTDENKSYIALNSDNLDMGDWQELLTPDDSVLSVNGYTGAISLDSDDISEGSNLYFTELRARGAISETITGIDYDNATGVFSITSGYGIPTTTKQGQWDTAFGWGDHASEGYITGIAWGEITGTLSSQSDLQSALNLKANLASPTFTGNINFPGSGIWNSSGNVGIGTTDPSAKLSISNTSGDLFTATSTNILRTVLRSTGLQLWYVNDGSAEVGSIVYSTPGGQPGILFFNSLGTGRSQIKHLGSGGGLGFAATSGSTNPADQMVLTTSGNVGIGTTGPTAKLDINSDILRLRTAKTPASAGESGNQGDIAWDSNYVYVCTATNTWKRSGLATW